MPSTYSIASQKEQFKLQYSPLYIQPTHQLDNLPIDILEAKKVHKKIDNQGYYLTKCPTINKQKLTTLTSSLGSIWNNQTISTIKKVENAAFIAGTEAGIEAHNECAYSINPPRYLALYCVQNQVVGGAFYIVNTAKLLEQVKPDVLHSMKTTRFLCNIIMDQPISTPLIRTFNNHNHVQHHLIYSALGSLAGNGYYTLHQKSDGYSHQLINYINTLLNNTMNHQQHTWHEGDLLIIDNLSHMHGRYFFKGNQRELLHLRIK